MSARNELTEALVAEARRGGLADRSLRDIATAVGTSHRMLLYHYGSREGLLAAVVGEVERQERERSRELVDADRQASMATQWAELTDPARAGEERLFFELAAAAARHVAGTEPFADTYVEPWFELVPDDLGPHRAERARAQLRLHLAVQRALLLDLLVTGDRAGVDAAMAAYAELWAAATGEGGLESDVAP